MAQIAPLRPKINTEVTQPSPARASRRRPKKRAGVRRGSPEFGP